MAHEKKIYLDCTKLTRDSYRGSRMIGRLRYYYGSRYRSFDRSMSDEDVFMYAYARHSQIDPNLPLTRERVARDYAAWMDGAPAPDYVCSQLRAALRDRDHRLVSVRDFEDRFVHAPSLAA